MGGLFYIAIFTLPSKLVRVGKLSVFAIIFG